jgi:hypothetical protein
MTCDGDDGTATIRVLLLAMISPHATEYPAFVFKPPDHIANFRHAHPNGKRPPPFAQEYTTVGLRR